MGLFRRTRWKIVVPGLAVVALVTAPVLSQQPAALAKATPGATIKPNAVGNLDCNGFSPIQRNIKTTWACADPQGYDGGRFYDNGHYIGHDEPDLRFISQRRGSGNDVVWNETLGVDPTAAPTVNTPGSDVTHFFELSIAPWISMSLCDSNSYPQEACTPESDANAAKGSFPGGGGAFLELQFYPPGFAPFSDNISCDNTHWCAAMVIWSLECTNGFETCNPNCEEPGNFAWIQMNGVPTGPPSPQLSDINTVTPNQQTLFMNGGDSISTHIRDVDVGGGAKALKISITDETTGQRGYMVSSAANGFMNTSITDCSGTPYNFAAEYDTASYPNTTPWAALQTNISTEYEIGHFTPCTRVTDKTNTGGDPYWNECKGPYEQFDSSEDPGEDAPCYPLGDTHGGTTDPNLVAGCTSTFGGGDLDFDGSSYWAEWPDSTTPDTWPSTFQHSAPTTGGVGYKSMQFEADVAASESSCTPTGGAGCRVPPPGGPGKFYPWWTQTSIGGTCSFEFGEMNNGNSYGNERQYGISSAWYFGTLESAVLPNPCV
jgi:hypothetical protein